MMPVLGLITIGRRGYPPFPIPLPLILLWPLAFAALLGMVIAGRLRRPRRVPAEASGASPSGRRAAVTPRPATSGVGALARVRVGLAAFRHLSGLRADVRSSDGDRIRVWVV